MSRYIDAEKIANHLLNIQQYCDKNKERLSNDFIIQKIFDTAMQLLYELNGEDVIPIKTVVEKEFELEWSPMRTKCNYCLTGDGEVVKFLDAKCLEGYERLCREAIERMVTIWKDEDNR